jgi:AcrR family transcriptional regulator
MSDSPGDESEPPTTPAARTARARARAEITREIVETARRHLATDGAAGLSLRAVARDLGMVSSAVYRYVPSRDDLLTLLIIETYDAVGAAVELEEAEVPREDLLGRWMAIAHGVRDWAQGHPQEWGLVYGTPVPGYVAPQDTVVPATRVVTLLVALLAEMQARGLAGQLHPMPSTVRASIAPVRAAVPDDVPDDLVVRGLMAWAQLLGTVTLEINGQFHDVVDDMPEYFDHVMTRIAEALGLGVSR